ncbi:MAG: 16S rRNA (cytosine(967)-C(5))-methyltransferase RsmB [Lachnospiraceae bacterium]|nr:16S rRNA (cytosine(967)-C(5))-methyltransferase RsmB [Lachnospiraceae bacterium]
MENIREIVLDMLLAVDREEAYSHQIIRDVLFKYDYLSGQEKAFMKRLFEGTIERRMELDYILNSISSVPVKKMKPLIRSLLRMSAYQILYMDSVPNAAAVSEAVKLAAKRKFVNLKGFVNGILRRLAAGTEIPMPSEEKEPVNFLSVTYSMPEWIVKHFLESFSYEDTKKLLGKMLAVRPVTIRFTAMSDLEKKALIKEMENAGVEVVAHPYVAQAYYLQNCENIADLPGFLEGKFTVQDASSMLAVGAAGIKNGDKVLDICAAPGGKTMLAAEYTGADGFVEARDVSDYKVELIEENIQRMGLANVNVRVQDATVADKNMTGWADVVLADVPCSGLGVMGKKRDIKYRQKEEALAEIVTLQKEILKNAVSYVKTGGVLLYSTCTINPAENEEMVAFLKKQPGITCETIEEYVKGLPGTETAPEGYIQLLPHVHDTDGFFFARFRKV